MEAIILAGGKGTRLRPFTTTLPKPLMPIGEHSILEIIIGQLKKAGITKITIAVNHMADLIMAFFGDGKRFGIEIAYSMEDKPLGTVGPLKIIKNLPENFLVMNGDVMSDIDYADLITSHINSKALFTIATYKRDSLIDFGVLEINNETHQLSKFIEKPTYHFDVSMGIYVMNRELLNFVPKDIPYGIDQLAINLLSKGESVHTFPFAGYWLDIGRPDDYDKANNDYIANPNLFQSL
jgi:NDP-sugar pyrophosphorylase family protein